MTVEKAVVNGIELAYETFGSRSDPAVLLVMGLGTQMIAWRDEFCAELAAAGFFVVRFDNRDVGQSAHLADLPVPNPVALLIKRSEPAYRLEDMADDVVGLLDVLGLDVVHLVGASMGGFISQHVALRAPDRIASLTLIMTSTGGRRVGTTSGDVLTAILRRKPATTRDEAIDASLSMYRLIQSPAYPQTDEEIREMTGLAYDRGYDVAGSNRQFGAVVAQTNRTRDLSRINVPTLVMHGLADKLVSFSGGVALAKTIPGAKLVAFHGMGHDLPAQLWPDFITEISAIATKASLVSRADIR